MFSIRSRERERRHYAFGSALIAPRSHSLPDEASQSALITPFVRWTFSLDREEEEEDHGWEEREGRSGFPMIEANISSALSECAERGRRGARDSHTLQICGGASGWTSFSFKHQREFAQNATRLPSFFGRVSPSLLATLND